MTDRKMSLIEEIMSRELEDALEGVDPMVGLLMVIEGLREAYGGNWQIVAESDGSYLIKPVRGERE
jgi:hypothetical protein